MFFIPVVKFFRSLRLEEDPADAGDTFHERPAVSEK